MTQLNLDVERLEDFLNHLNKILEYIKFMMELEEDGKNSFLDILITREDDGTLVN